MKTKMQYKQIKPYDSSIPWLLTTFLAGSFFQCTALDGKLKADGGNFTLQSLICNPIYECFQIGYHMYSLAKAASVAREQSIHTITPDGQIFQKIARVDLSFGEYHLSSAIISLAMIGLNFMPTAPEIFHFGIVIKIASVINTIDHFIFHDIAMQYQYYLDGEEISYTEALCFDDLILEISHTMLVD